MADAAHGRLVIISGPSGAGKSTVVRALYDACPLPLVHSVSATTRAPRPGERDGIDYHFLTREEFSRRREADEFLECCEVFGCGDWYGTLKSEVTAGRTSGKWVILEIDVHGAMAVLGQESEAITVFIKPPSLAELERRLRNRGTESEEKIQRRLEVARHELAFENKYRYHVLNDTFAQAVDDICLLLRREAEPTK